jgi:hypothetical protein
MAAKPRFFRTPAAFASGWNRTMSGKRSCWSVSTRPNAGMLARNAKARAFFESQAPSYRRAAIWWVISAKRDETRLKRAQTLIDLSAQGKFIPQFIRR